MAATKPDEGVKWRLLDLIKSFRKTNIPPLYYKFSTSDSGPSRLTLHLSDLITLYVCTLNKADIIAEAQRSNSPIDPSSDAKQFTVLLNYLSQSLQGAENLLVRDTPATADATGEPALPLRLRTTIALPSPLPPLSFTFSLQQQSPSDFSAVLLHPTLRALQHTQKEQEGLLEVIRDKDHVIQRLLDKVGNYVQGDMSVVFPVLTGKRDRGAKEAEKWVKGLKVFERDGDEVDVGRDEGVGGLVAAERGDEVDLAAGSSETVGNWVSKLPGAEALEVRENWVKTARRTAKLPRRESTQAFEGDSNVQGANGGVSGSETESDDEFERQPTPPSARKPASTPARNHGKSDLKGSSDGDDEPPSKKQETGPPRGKQSPGRKLGGLGKGRKAASQQKDRGSSSSPEPAVTVSQRTRAAPSPSPEQRGDSNASTATETESENDNAKRPTKSASKRKQAEQADKDSSASESKQSQTPAKSKTTRLGGLRRKRQKSSDESSDEAREEEDLKPATPSRKLGRLKQASPAKQKEKQKGNAKDSGVNNSDNSDSDTDTAAAKLSGSISTNTTPSRRLGRLRGRAEDAASPPAADADREGEAAEAATESEDEDLDGPATRTRNTGSAAAASKAIEGATANDKKQQAERHSSPPVKSSQSERRHKEHEKVEETPEQAAQRRREELKRKTNAGAAAGAGGGKKRRRL